MEEIVQYQKLMAALKDVNPSFYMVLKKYKIEEILKAIPSQRQRKLFLAMIAITTSSTHRKLLLRELEKRENEVKETYNIKKSS